MCSVELVRRDLQWLRSPVGQGQGLLSTTHPLILVIICAKYGKNSPRTVHAVERTQGVPFFSSFIAKSWLNDLERYRSMSKERKESIQNCIIHATEGTRATEMDGQQAIG